MTRGWMCLLSLPLSLFPQKIWPLFAGEEDNDNLCEQKWRYVQFVHANISGEYFTTVAAPDPHTWALHRGCPLCGGHSTIGNRLSLVFSAFSACHHTYTILSVATRWHQHRIHQFTGQNRPKRNSSYHQRQQQEDQSLGSEGDTGLSML